MSQTNKKPPIWIIVMIALIPQISEAIYTPALPEIAETLKTSIPLTEHTLAIYLLGFAFGVFLWGTRADAIGRRPAVLLGYVLFSIACIGCYFSKTIEALLAWHFVQGLGGAVGSVMGQTIARDSFKGKERGVVFSTVGMAITIGPALGPVLGGLIVQNFYWNVVFLFLLIFGFIVLYNVFNKLPETHPHFDNRHNRVRWPTAFKKMVNDPQVMTCGFVVGGIVGISFSIYSEAPFYFIEILKISPAEYGFIFPFISSAAVFGGFMSRVLNKKGYTPIYLIFISITILLFMTTLMTISTYVGLIDIEAPSRSIIASIGFMFFISFCFGMGIPNALSLALTKYGHMAGTAGALFGFYYYIVNSAVTYGMGIFHNGTLYAMPSYFMIISGICFSVFLLNKNKLEHDHD